MSYRIRRASAIIFSVALALSALPLVFELVTPEPVEASEVALTAAMAAVFPAAGQVALIASAVAGGLLISGLSEWLLPPGSAHRRREALLIAVLVPCAALALWLVCERIFGARFVAPAVLSGVHLFMAACASLFARHLVVPRSRPVQPVAANPFGRTLS